MSLIESLENATDEQIVEAETTMRKKLFKKILIGTVAAVVSHFLAEFAVTAIEKKINREITE